MAKSTNKELVDELIKRNTKGKYHSIIERARDNGYHDFKFDEDKYPDCVCPKSATFQNFQNWKILERA